MKQLLINVLSRVGLLRTVERLTRPLRWPAKRWVMRRFFRQLVRPGDLVFDIGANVGDWSTVFLQLGARIIAVEPQQACAARLRRRFGKLGDRLIVVPKALAQAEGDAELTHCDFSNQLGSMSRDFIERSRFSGERWSGTERVQTTTLDRLIEQYGAPAFCKIDVEGFEPQVLAGLNRPLPLLSFEFHGEFLSSADACMTRLESLGDYEFNATLFPAWAFCCQQWLGRRELLARLQTAGPGACGDVYARRRKMRLSTGHEE
jgi:FkbM family methyltransferase